MSFVEQCRNDMKLFRDYELRSVFDETLNKVYTAIARYTNDEIMANDLQILCSNLYEMFKIVPVTLLEEDMGKRTFKQGNVNQFIPAYQSWDGSKTIVVDGVILRCAYPFEGSAILFQCQGSTFSLSGYPDIEVNNGEIILEYRYAIQDVDCESWNDEVERRKATDIESIRQGLSYVNRDVCDFDSGFKDKILQMLAERKKKIEVFYRAAKVVNVCPVTSEYGRRVLNPVKRQLLPIAHGYEDREVTYLIDELSYEEILNAIKHIASTMERTPRSYRGMQEEDLRNAVLAGLNGMFLGRATGEAFRNNGKTDICIESENRAAFVAECKMWTGDKAVTEALEQLDGYLTWRDCKTALIYFVRRKDFMAILGKVEGVLKAISFLSGVQTRNVNEFQCRMASKSCPGQIKAVRILLFNLDTRDIVSGNSCR